MIDYKAIEDSIYDIIEPILNPSPIIMARQASPAPNSSALPYTTILVKNLTQIGREITGTTDINGDTNINTDLQVNVELQSYGLGARDDIQKLRAAFNASSVVEAFLRAGLAMVRHPVVVDIPKIINVEWEEVALLTVTFNLGDLNVDNTSFIATVLGFTGDIKDCAGTTVRTITTTITSP